MSKNRSLRLRKKLRVDEFQEFGFPITFSFADHAEDAALDVFLDQFLSEAIEKNQLLFGGAIGEEFSGFITYELVGSATEAHRALLNQWLTAHPKVSNVVVGDLIDAWRD